MASDWRILSNVGRTPLALTATRLLTERLAERGCAPALLWGGTDADADLMLEIEAGLGADGYRIDRAGGQGAWRVTGGDERGLLYGIGAFLRGFRPASGAAKGTFGGRTGASEPEMPMRGMYFATHFHYLKNAKNVAEPLALMDRAAARMPSRCAAAWRWRLLWLRAAMDAELVRSGGRPTATTEAYFDEVERISFAQGAEIQCSAPSLKTLRRVLAEQPKDV